MRVCVHIGTFNFLFAKQIIWFNPLVHERPDKPFSLQIQRLDVDLKLNCGFYFLHPGH